MLSCDVAIVNGMVRSMRDGDFKESEHPRGQSDNPGQFVAKGEGSAAKSEEPKKELTPQQAKAQKKLEIKLKYAESSLKIAKERGYQPNITMWENKVKRAKEALNAEPQDAGSPIKWQAMTNKLEINRQFKQKLGIKRVQGDVKMTNLAGEHLAKLTEKFPAVRKMMLAHTASGLNFVKKEELKGSSGRTIGRWHPPSGYGRRPIISVAADYKGWGHEKETPVQGEWSAGSAVQDVINHELGHHVQYGIGRIAREKWDDMIEKLGGSSYLFKGVSKYGATDNRDRYAEVPKGNWFQEAFAESFAFYTHPGYKNTLPKPIHNYMVDKFGGRDKI